MTSAPCVVSTTTKLSDEIDRRLTASAGYDSFVHCHCAVAIPAGPRGARTRSSASTPSTSCTSCRPYCLGRRERQLERRALHVIDQDVQVVGIDQRVLGRRVEEVRRDCGRRTDRAARCCATSTAAERPLRRPARPARCQVAAIVPGIAGHHAHVERADVDAELQRVGRDHGAHAAFAQPFLDLAPALRQIAAAVAANLVRRVPAGRRNRPSGTSSGSRWPAGSARTRSAAAAASGTPRQRAAFPPDTTAGCRAAG